ncbi:MAG: hypothetical protein OQJ97_09745 [Rhodospirillales bacterium]|nr:hypothetical protein [Rhodospirillales bacterium]
MNRLNLTCWGLLAFFVLALPTKAEAFCILNQSQAKLHVIALDASGYNADIAPKKNSCCKANICKGNKQTKETSVLVVTRYIPVAEDNRPGWLAECKGKLKADDTLVVKGNDKKISCSLK